MLEIKFPFYIKLTIAEKGKPGWQGKKGIPRQIGLGRLRASMCISLSVCGAGKSDKLEKGETRYHSAWRRQVN